MGTSRVVTDHFTILSFRNISFIEQRLQAIDKIFEKSIHACGYAPNKVTHSFHCSESLKLIQIQVPLIHEKFETLLHLTGHTLSRRKRGLINGVSTAFKWLFGTPDADDAEYYTQSINNLLDQNRENQLLMKQQVNILSSSISNYNKSVESFKRNEYVLNENIIKFNNFSKQTSDELNKMNSELIITDHMNILTQLTSELNEELDVHINSILFAKQNIFHPSILTPKDLREQLLPIPLKSDLELPIPANDINNIYKYLSICKLTVIYNHEILIFAIKIPLVHERVYNIYRLIPLPVPSATHPNLFAFIQPSNKFLMISNTRTHYGLLEDVSDCLRISTKDFICENLVVYLTIDRPVCELLLRNPLIEHIPEDCAVKYVYADVEIWHSLGDNSWLFVTSKPTMATINCGIGRYRKSSTNTEFNDVKISNMGILQLNAKCRCYTSSAVLVASGNSSINVTHFTPNLDITLDDCCSEKIEILKSEDMDPINLRNINLEELKNNHRQLQQVDEILEANLSKPTILRQFRWPSFVGSLFAIGIIVTAIVCCCSSRCRSCLPQNGCLSNCRGLFEICINSKNSGTSNNRYSEQPVEFRRYVASPGNSSDESNEHPRERTPMIEETPRRPLNEQPSVTAPPVLERSNSKRRRPDRLHRNPKYKNVTPFEL